MDDKEYANRHNRKVAPANSSPEETQEMNNALAKFSQIKSIPPAMLEQQIAQLQQKQIISEQQFREELTTKVAQKLQVSGLVSKDTDFQSKNNHKNQQSCRMYISRKAKECTRYSKRKCICCKWTLNQWFEYTIYFMILLSMIMLIIDNPMLDPESDISRVLGSIDYFITIAFTVEAIFRIIALGFIFGSVP